MCNQGPLMLQTSALYGPMRGYWVPLLQVRAAAAERCSQQFHAQECVTCTL